MAINLIKPGPASGDRMPICSVSPARRRYRRRKSGRPLNPPSHRQRNLRSRPDRGGPCTSCVPVLCGDDKRSRGSKGCPGKICDVNPDLCVRTRGGKTSENRGADLLKTYSARRYGWHRLRAEALSKRCSAVFYVHPTGSPHKHLFESIVFHNPLFTKLPAETNLRFSDDLLYQSLPGKSRFTHTSGLLIRTVNCTDLHRSRLCQAMLHVFPVLQYHRLS